MNKEIVSLVNEKQEFILTSHVNPDGDSIGSEIALYLYLKSLGKTARIFNYSPTPQNYTFLDKDNIIEQFDEDKHKGFIEYADLIFVLDTNEYDRVRTLAPYIQASNAKKVLIDHHLGFNGIGFDFYIVDTDSPATGEILYRFFKDIEAENSGGNQESIITTDMALALYTAILTDTGSFRYDRTDSRTHDIISDLLGYGIKPFDVYSEVYNRASIGKLHLLGRFLNNITLVYDGTVAYSTLLQKDFEETLTDEYAIDGFTTHLMSLEKVKMCIVITETKRGVKLSFRSKGEVSSNEFAKEFGGGGHQNASGAFVPGGKIDELTPMVIDKAGRFV